MIKKIKLYVNWDENEILTEKDYKKELDKTAQEWNTEDVFEDFLDHFSAKEVYEQFKKNGEDAFKFFATEFKKHTYEKAAEDLSFDYNTVEIEIEV